ncbi:hypothetical protein [uncultured Lacinutrix sp.]|uniref:hypothetical protein n=1 Tax=uncultured Lacinutrix sp. TaxID=574032 RepID=UPI00263469A3|nr:hypothetical protein [uncultured Lacinutrix sp.]
MQHKNTFDDSKEFENSEGQQRFLCCNETSFSCPSLHLSFKQAKQRLINRGMSEADFKGLMGFLRGLARQLLDEEHRKINNRSTTNGYD